MTAAQIEEIVFARMGKILDTLASKGAQYAVDLDRLAHLRRSAATLDTSIPEALLGMLVKHWTRLVMWVQSHHIPSQAEVDETLGDIMTYLVLLEAVYTEERNPT